MMAVSATYSVWVSYGLVLILLIACTITVMITPTESSPDVTKTSSAVPLVRQRSEAYDPNGKDLPFSDVEVRNRIQEIFNRTGYSNPARGADDSVEAPPTDVGVRTDSPASRNRRRPLVKIDKTFDVNKSFVIKHANGTITYVPPKNLDLSGGVSATTGLTDPSVLKGPNGLVDKMSEASSRLVFPTGPEADTAKCYGNLCNEVADYPLHVVNDLVDREGGRFDEVFGNDNAIDQDRIVSRFDEDADGTSFQFICPSIERVIHPKEGINEDKRKVLIVNTEKYQQGVRIEVCRSGGKPCDALRGFSSKTECQQVHHYRTLLAVDPDTQKVYKERIMLPSCCKCALKGATRSDYRRKRETKDGL